MRQHVTNNKTIQFRKIRFVYSAINNELSFVMINDTE